MTSGRIALLAALLVIAFAVGDAFTFGSLDTASRPLYHGAVRVALLALVAGAAGLAATRFGWWREYVGRAWTLFFIAYFVLTIGEVLRRFTTDTAIAAEVCVVVANVAIVAAYFMTARSFRAAGLDFGGSRWRTVLATMLSLVVALAICQNSIMSSYEAVRGGALSWGALVSPLADVITFALVAPLLLTAFALRGGQQFWMFALLTTGTVGWMLNQGMDLLLRLFGDVSASTLRTGRMTGFAIACIFIAAAALTQWLAAHRTMRGVARV